MFFLLFLKCRTIVFPTSWLFTEFPNWKKVGKGLCGFWVQINYFFFIFNRQYLVKFSSRELGEFRLKREGLAETSVGAINEETSGFLFFFFFFFGRPMAYGVPRPGIRSEPQLWLLTTAWSNTGSLITQCGGRGDWTCVPGSRDATEPWIPLCRSRNSDASPFFFFFFYLLLLT